MQSAAGRSRRLRGAAVGEGFALRGGGQRAHLERWSEVAPHKALRAIRMRDARTIDFDRTLPDQEEGEEGEDEEGEAGAKPSGFGADASSSSKGKGGGKAKKKKR